MKNYRFWIGILISLVALIWAIQGIHINNMWSAFKNANYIWLLPFSILIIIQLWVRAYRWKSFFEPPLLFPVSRFFFLINVGYFLNNLFPLRLGDLVRSYILCKETNTSMSRALSIIFLERVVDTIVIIIMLILVIPFLPVFPDEIRQPLIVMSCICLLVIFFLYILANQKERCLQIFDFFTGHFPKLKFEKFRGTLSLLLDGLVVLRSFRLIFPVLIWTAINWLINIVCFNLIFWAFGLNLPFTASIFTMTVTSLGFVIPASPGSLGVFHSLVIFCLGIFSIDNNNALSCALVFQGASFLLMIPVGFYSMWKENLTFEKINLMKANQ